MRSPNGVKEASLKTFRARRWFHQEKKWRVRCSPFFQELCMR